jgi:ABC-type lipoprotein export system ATPase subunit
MSKPIARVRGLKKTFAMSGRPLCILDGVDLDVAEGEFVAIEGRSGSGKSTLLHLMGLLDDADAGTIELAGQEIGSLGASRRALLRNRSVGFVFQFYHLLPELDVVQNAMLPALVSSARDAGLRSRAIALLSELGLADRLSHKPRELSGGERQRVAIARALINRPGLLLADEPTGNLDQQTGRQIMDVLESLHRSGQSIVMVTHDRSIAGRADRSLRLEAGRLAQ